MSNGGTKEAFASISMSVENEPIIPVQVKCVEVQSVQILRNPRATDSSTLRVNKSQEEQLEVPIRSVKDDVEQPSTCALEDEMPPTSPTSPTSGSPRNTLTPSRFQFDPSLSYAEKVTHEMIITERIYLDNLKQIIDGFLGPVSNHPDLDVSQEDVNDLFINVEEIYNFNWILLKDMEECNYDPVKLAECFVVKQIGFDVYTKYCTHYPRSMEVLMEWNQREDTANFIKEQQEALGHTLPLCSFLLKPVQRILKYHLLLGNIAKHYKQSEDEEGFQVIQKALSAMTNVAKHINEMKRKHENAVQLQEIQSILVDYEGPNLTSFGSLVLEDTFRLYGTKTDRYLFLFEKALLITKRRSDGTFTWKATVMYSNMMLADSVFREPLTFQVIPFNDRKMCYTFMARNVDIKQVWMLELKRRLLDSYAAAVPMKAKQIILGNGREECEKENAEPESDRKSLINNSRKGANQQRMYSSKDNGVPSNKLNKGVESDRRKSKDVEETLEDRWRVSDTTKSPLRRKLRVFKKRKFSKDQEKIPKRVSWSSDDNNDESRVESEPLSPSEELESEDIKVPDAPAHEPIITERQNSIEVKHIDNNDNVVSIESLLRGGTTMVSVSREDNHSAGQVSLGKTALEALPIKKRRLAKENRERCNSMPVGNFSSGDAKSAESFRTHSLSELCEKFAEKDFLANPASVKELENKYGLINLRENTAVIRKRRPGSFDELLAAFEKNSCRSSGISNLTDDAMNRIAGDRTVKQTLKRVSAAFSDISANFSPEKTPTSSTEELTEDLTGPDDDDFRVFQENKDMYQYMDDPQKEGSVSSVESKAYQNDSSRGSDKEIGAVWNHLQIPSDSFSTSPSNEDEDTSINDLQSSEDRNSTLLSERSSCADTLSDSCDERYEDPRFSTNRFNGTYQKVFCLKRAFSEENLVSKSAFNETMNGSISGYTAGIASRSYSQFGQKHLPIVRSKSMESSSVRRWSDSHPFSFCVTPKKKIVIKDRLWETIKEDPEISNHEKTSLDRDGRLVRRRRKRRTSQENKKNVKKGAGVGESENVNRKRVLSTGASLEIGDYRTAKSEQKSDARDDKQSRSAVQHKRGEGTTTRPPPNASRNVTKVEVALKRNAKLKGEKNVVSVDANVSVVPHSINYLCIEKIPSDERPTRNGHIESGAEDNLKSDATSKVEQLSKYFSEFKPVDNKRKSKRTNSLRNLKNVKKRIEEMKLRERNFLKASTALKKEEVVKAELDSIQNIKDRIDELRRSTVDEEQTAAKMKDLQSALNEGIHNVKHLKNRIEAIASNNPSSAEADSQFNEEELGKQLQSRLHIRDCAEKLQRSNVKENNDDRNIKLDENFNEELRTRQRIKDCIERLQKGTKREVESGMDITISDESERVESLSSPRRNEELRTVVIKRGWVQQFIQKIETGS